jgi:hypothetical protein
METSTCSRGLSYSGPHEKLTALCENESEQHDQTLNGFFKEPKEVH